MKKTKLIKIIKEELDKVIKEQSIGSDPPELKLQDMTEEQMRDLGAEALYAKIGEECDSNVLRRNFDACKTAKSVYRELNPTGSI